jgi:hypothetical protein
VVYGTIDRNKVIGIGLCMDKVTYTAILVEFHSIINNKDLSVKHIDAIFKKHNCTESEFRIEYLAEQHKLCYGRKTPPKAIRLAKIRRKWENKNKVNT